MLSDLLSPQFAKLCDLVASDRLLVVTGAGISVGVRQKHAQTPLPGWGKLVASIYMELEAKLSADERREITPLIAKLNRGESISASALIEIATRLNEVDAVAFDRELRFQVTPEPGSYSKTHEAICALGARGIITFNYDTCHENAFTSAGMTVPVLVPSDERDFVRRLHDNITTSFLLKAHGCINRTDFHLVLDRTAYRNLLARSPAYRAFVQNLLTNFDCLFVGFGLSDPDFDLFIDVIASSYGSPIRTHVAIRHINQRNEDDEFVLKHKHGIGTLYISDYAKIPEILIASTQRAGPKLQAAILATLDSKMTTRDGAHRVFERLGAMGKRCASAALTDLLNKETNEFRIGEIAYALGQIDAKANKSTLFQLVESDTYNTAVPAARALTVLRGVLEPSDISTINSWIVRYQNKRYPDDPHNRLLKYAEYYSVYVPAKYASDPPP